MHFFLSIFHLFSKRHAFFLYLKKIVAYYFSPIWNPIRNGLYLFCSSGWMFYLCTHNMRNKPCRIQCEWGWTQKKKQFFFYSFQMKNTNFTTLILIFMRGFQLVIMKAHSIFIYAFERSFERNDYAHKSIVILFVYHSKSLFLSGKIIFFEKNKKR